MLAHCDHGRTPTSGAGEASSIARYSRRLPSGSRKYTAAAGIQPMTLGSSVSAREEGERRHADRSQAITGVHDVRERHTERDV